MGAGIIVGLFVIWLQVSIFTSLTSLGVGARSYQTSLQGVASQVGAGEYEGAKSDLKDAQAAATNIIDSAHGFNMTVLGKIPGINTAVNNWERLTGAVENITGSTDDMLTLFGDLSGKSGNGKIFNNGAIDIAALKALPPRV